MNIPFGLPTRKEVSTRKKEESKHSPNVYEHKIAEYRDTLEAYKKCLLEYSGKIEKRVLEHQLPVVQSALEITYLKDQIDNSIELLQELKTDQMNKVFADLEHLISSVLDMSYKMDDLDKIVVNRLADVLIDLQKQNYSQNNELHEELIQEIEQLDSKLNKNNTLLRILFLFNLVTLGGLGFVILFIIKIMKF
jgi:hypothetical protein